ncbi:MAG TPA: MerR family transcriptional regulator [Solirubrobacteraceae bacterium]|nr:MerR family transcriptional regulator [Solirubrobacteraceae bacterium]
MAGAPGIYSIGAVSRMLGVSQPALRSWEDRYGLVVAERSEGGRRIYTRAQVDQLRFVKEQLDAGLSAADAHRLLAEREAGAPPGAAPESSPSAAQVVVLLAENDQYGAELSGFILRAEGFDVEVATSAAEAEEKFTARDPVLAIVELMISGGVGRELCQRLKQRREVPLVCISSLDLGEEALAAGADAFLKKPLDPVELVSTVTDLLGQGEN